MRVFAFLGVSVFVVAQDKPADLLKRGFETFDRLDGARVKEKIESAFHISRMEGVIRKDLAWIKGNTRLEKDPPGKLQAQYGKDATYEVWARADDYLCRIDHPKFKAWLPPDEIGQLDGIMAAFIRNPCIIVQESRGATGLAKVAGTEKIDDVECTVIEGHLTKEKDKLEVLRRFVGKCREAKSHANDGMFKTVLDMNATQVTYKWWIDAAGNLRQLVHTIKIELKPELKALVGGLQGKSGGDAPPLDLFSGTWTLYFYDFGKDLPLDPPKEVRARFRLK